MTITKTITTAAASAVIALGAALAGTAPATADDARIITSDTWKPGFRNDGDGHYSRIVRDHDASDSRQVTRVEHRDTWAPGFQGNGEGDYERLVKDVQSPHGGSTSIATRDTWAPGYTLDDMSDYTRIVPNGDAGSQTATMPQDAR
ncbi:hypothetical protein C882_1873 [Caenispirillum salinarum AK4]|uniref:Uncharacterized protein n=1 Tax=Caenispirillum salinarum AK4 TaxID=1238182 RepID=K9HFB0_9PROT|nr:hypothetical protein [Caenispirillum salinarum]EKV27371.1 hypothetical protein C882_1873 [Caenispirillum salinarum AK4]